MVFRGLGMASVRMKTLSGVKHAVRCFRTSDHGIAILQARAHQTRVKTMAISQHRSWGVAQISAAVLLMATIGGCTEEKSQRRELTKGISKADYSQLIGQSFSTKKYENGIKRSDDYIESQAFLTFTKDMGFTIDSTYARGDFEKTGNINICSLRGIVKVVSEKNLLLVNSSDEDGDAELLNIFVLELNGENDFTIKLAASKGDSRQIYGCGRNADVPIQGNYRRTTQN
jgi:hypothetical protein